MAGPLQRRRERERLERLARDFAVNAPNSATAGTGAEPEAQATYSTAYQAGMREEMIRDATIFVLGTDLYDRGGHFSQVKGLGPEFGADRVRDTPISEAAMVAAGVGAAMNGTRPVVDLNFIDFSYGAMDELVNQAAKVRYMWNRPVPLVVRATAGVAQGGAQHNNSLQSWFMGTPGLAVVFPSRPWDVKGLLKSALRGHDPVVFLMHKLLTGARGPVGGEDDVVPIGSARIVRPGRDVTLATYGYGVVLAEKAAAAVSGEGIDVEVIDLRTLAPLDVDTVAASVRRTGRALVLDEAPAVAGPAAEIAAAISDAAFWYLDQPVTRLTGRHSPIPHSPALIAGLLPDEAATVDALRRLARASGPEVAAS
ncbi:alpha-ketoacid dehydrogenase subunit beta [Nakamurella flavida]|uniref:Alpha-ketoacid dehydrogenase subunit beta n=1 Tax=Nakamurella flavida TaxID=363630 RepID=A0A938YRG9_9ACTN|nr:transketolase C-terminal domain-containing protein [Nakamurella flavida]MBM9477878.1 alpha-ketoacid dehydrogenase subunit beta [Nakamurella flavida]MDP9778408.1 pyruvate dehydrogenase E1 component beta subunit [Nakamurella flavida]